MTWPAWKYACIITSLTQWANLCLDSWAPLWCFTKHPNSWSVTWEPWLVNRFINIPWHRYCTFGKNAGFVQSMLFKRQSNTGTACWPMMQQFANSSEHTDCQKESCLKWLFISASYIVSYFKLHKPLSIKFRSHSGISVLCEIRDVPHL